MNRTTRHTLKAIGGTTAVALTLTMATLGTTPGAGAVESDRGPAAGTSAEPAGVSGADGTGEKRLDDFSSPLAERASQLREKAVAALIDGRAEIVNKDGSRSIRYAGKFVQYDTTRTANVFTVLSQFGTKTMEGVGGDAGPLAGDIPAPDRDWDGSASDDNSTYWEPRFDRAHFQDLMFGEGESFKDFYDKQSNGRFDVQGDVSPWVKVPFNEARYGNNANEQDGYWSYIEDTLAAWYKMQVRSGKTDAQIKAYLAQFDVWDRYDSDDDGNFDEPDGYIDHFQAIHAGEGEEAGGGAQGEDAIWSHRWYVNSTDQGSTGPQGNLLGGAEIGDTGFWVGDYTTEPENGGLGVFTHEFGHDLGLPDLYDTAGGDNSVSFWSLMSAGSWLNRGGDSIGTTPGYMDAWSKLQLGWLDHTTVDYGDDTRAVLAPASRASLDDRQAVVVNLPDKTVSTEYNTPNSGEYEWWSGSGDNLNNTLTRSVDMTGVTGAAELTTAAWYQIEADYDYLYLEASTDGGDTYDTVGEAVTGSSDGWEQLSYDLSPYAGEQVELRFRYSSDGGVAEAGAFLDDLVITADGAEVLSDDVESGANGWTARGFSRMNGTDTRTIPRYYIVENRTYDGYDDTLRTGPYNFGWGSSRPDWVERFPYQKGMVVWYVNGEYADNNTSAHPGAGMVLPVDAHPKAIAFPNDTLLGNRRQPYDAAFGLTPTARETFHLDGVKKVVPSKPAVAVFDDSDRSRYYRKANPQGSVKVAGSGTSIRVVDSVNGGQQLRLAITFED